MKLIDKDKFYNYVKPFPVIEKQDLTDVKLPSVSSEGESAPLINAVDLVLGQDSTLWVLDIGISDTLSGHPSRSDDPKILGFNPATGNVNM